MQSHTSPLPSPRIKVFISYSHDSDSHKQSVLRLADQLRDWGIDAEIDQYEPAPPSWPRWMEDQITAATFVILVCTHQYAERVSRKVPPGTGLGGCWEAELIYQLLYENNSINEKYLPVFLDTKDATHVPTPLRSSTRYDLSGARFGSGFLELYRRITNQPNIERPTIGQLKSLPSRRKQAAEPIGRPESSANRPASLNSVATAEIVTLSHYSIGFPDRPENELMREHILQTIETILSRNNDILSIEGDEGIGKTTLCAHFILAHPQSAISLFITPANRVSYDSQTIKLSLTRQLAWLLYGTHTPPESSLVADLEYSYGELQRKARRSRSHFYFIIDGLGELITQRPSAAHDICTLLPIGREGFKFIFTGDASAVPQPLASLAHAKSFPLTGFSLDETFKYLEDIIQDKALIKDLYSSTRGLPGRLYDVRRLIRSGNSPLECADILSKHHPDGLFSLEWKRTSDSGDLILKLLALLSLDDRPYTVDTLAELTAATATDVINTLAPLTFLRQPDTAKPISFASDSFRRFAAEKLRHLRNWVHQAKIKKLLAHPESDEALSDLPIHFAESSQFPDLLNYLSPQHIFTMLRRTQSLARVQATVELGLSSAERLNRDGDMLRFALEYSLLVNFSSTGAGIAETEALVSLGKFDAATAIANAGLLREDRLHALAIIGKGRREKGQPLSPEFLNQIRTLAKSIDVKALGQRTLDIAAQLICVDAELALDLIDQVKPSDLEREKAIAKLSVLTLETLGAEQSVETFETIRARGFGERITLLLDSMSAVSGKWTPSSLLANISKIEKGRDKLFIINSWLRAQTDSTDVAHIIQHGLELAIRGLEEPIDATLLRRLAERLHRDADTSRIKNIVAMFDAQMGGAAKLGPSVEFIRLQVGLAQCEARYDIAAADNRLISTYYDITQFPDLVTRCTALAWLLEGQSAVDQLSQYPGQLSIGDGILRELETAFVTLLDTTAEHYRAGIGTLEPLTISHLDKALDLIELINTQARRDRALFETIGWLCHTNRPDFGAAARKVLSRIEDSFTRERALASAIEHMSDASVQLSFNDDIEKLIRTGIQIADARTRAMACAHGMVYLAQHTHHSAIDLKPLLEVTMESAWKAIDLGWLRVTTGFEIAYVLSSHIPSLSSRYITETEALRSNLGGLANRDAVSAYELCVSLSIRAFSGLVPQHAYSNQDLELLAVLIEAIPGAGSRAMLWSDLALECAQANNSLCVELVNEKLRPLLSDISQDDSEYRSFVIAQVSPALFLANNASALGLIEGLQIRHRDHAYSNIIDFLFRGELGTEPEDYVQGTGYNVPYTTLTKICDTLMYVDSDARIFDCIEKIVDCLTSTKLTKVSYKTGQKDEIYRRLNTIIGSKFPSLRHIRHDGYKVIARSQLARFRNDPNVVELAEFARAIPNTADRALVMFYTALAIYKSSRAIADSLISEARLLVQSIPADWDRLERLIGFAQEARGIAPHLSRQILEEAVSLAPKANKRTEDSLRRIVDLAHRIDVEFARTLVDRFDDDKARKNAQRQIELLEIKQKVIDERPVYEELQVASRTEYRKLGTMLLGALQSDRMVSIKPKSIRPCIQAAARQPLREAYLVMAWIVQNAVDKYESTDKAGTYLRPIFEATLASAELAAQLANRSLAELREAQLQSGVRSSAIGKKNVDIFSPEQALRYIRSWLDANAKDTVLIFCPTFSGDDLVILQSIKSLEEGVNSTV